LATTIVKKTQGSIGLVSHMTGECIETCSGLCGEKDPYIFGMELMVGCGMNGILCHNRVGVYNLHALLVEDTYDI
jgi:hypothetical protein